MVLASMIATDEDSLVCDLAETYGIFNYKGLPLKLVAVLACGLREDSRIMMKMVSARADTDTLLLATIADNLRILAWQNTKDGQAGKNIPKSITNMLMGAEDKQNNREYEIYASGDDFKAAWKAIAGG